MIIGEFAATFPEENKTPEQVLSRIRCGEKQLKNKLGKIEKLTPKTFLDFPLEIDERF